MLDYNCPICCGDINKVTTINSGNFDQSLLYNKITVVSCTKCGHMFNVLSPADALNLPKYYTNEYALCHGLDFISEPVDSNSDILNITQKDLNLYLNAIVNCNTIGKLGITSQYETIVLDQFIEHLLSPWSILKDVSRHLVTGGKLKITCPDAARYTSNTAHFINYNFLIREHIQHFDLNHLIMLANSCGFFATDIEFTDVEIISGIFMPSLSVTFKLIHNCYCYGIGREFLYMQANGYFDSTKIIGLIDNTPCKQKYTARSYKIYDDSVIPTLPEDSVILITAIAHKEVIKTKLLNLGFKGTII